MKMIFTLLLLLAVGPIAMAEGDDSPSSFLCIADFSTGYAKEGGKWRPAKFDISDNRYILRHPNELDLKRYEGLPSKKKVSWVWLDFGKEVSWHTCKNEATASGRIYCPSGGLDLVVNIKSLVFQLYYHGDYTMWNDPEDPDGRELKDTPFIQIGKCSPL
jgi:hypothetical protein